MRSSEEIRSYPMFASCKRAFTCSVVGNEGHAPRHLTATAPAALAQCSASDIVAPSASFAAKPPQNASPAAVASTCVTEIERIHRCEIGPSPYSFVLQTQTCAPNLMIARFPPFASSFVAARLAPWGESTVTPASSPASLSFTTSISTQRNQIIGKRLARNRRRVENRRHAVLMRIA